MFSMRSMSNKLYTAVYMNRPFRTDLFPCSKVYWFISCQIKEVESVSDTQNHFIYKHYLPINGQFHNCQSWSLYPHHKMWGGLYWICFVASVGRSVRPSPFRVGSITALLMKGFPLNLNDTFNPTRGCAEPMLSMCQLKAKVTVKGQIFNKQILHIVLCLLKNSFTNGRNSFKLERHIHLN